IKELSPDLKPEIFREPIKAQEFVVLNCFCVQIYNCPRQDACGRDPCHCLCILVYDGDGKFYGALE
ncbi:MAG: hypothetical protein ACUVQT_05825, partial [bacterium]